MPSPCVKSSKKRSPAQVLSSVLDKDECFEELVSLLPLDLEELAGEFKAIERRRNLRSAVDLLRLALVYALKDWPLRLVGAWTSLWGEGLSDVAVFKRLKKSPGFLSELVSRLLEEGLGEACRAKLKVIDATTIQGPGAKMAEWRLHVSFCLGELRIDEAELTDVHGGETLSRHEIREGDIIMADRIYSTKRSITKVIGRGAHFIIRVNWQNLPLCDGFGDRLDILEWQRGASEGELLERQVYLMGEPEVPLRLISMCLSEKVAHNTRQRMCKEAKRKGYELSQRSLEAAGYMTVVSDIWEWQKEEVFSLYRYRWQVELLFKRLKSVLNLDGLRAKDKDLAQAYLFGKLLAYLLAELLIKAFKGEEKGSSQWRLLEWIVSWLSQVAEGSLLGAVHFEKLKRYFIASPRRRPNQEAMAQQLTLPLTCA